MHRQTDRQPCCLSPCEPLQPKAADFIYEAASLVDFACLRPIVVSEVVSRLEVTQEELAGKVCFAWTHFGPSLKIHLGAPPISHTVPILVRRALLRIKRPVDEPN